MKLVTNTWLARLIARVILVLVIGLFDGVKPVVATGYPPQCQSESGYNNGSQSSQGRAGIVQQFKRMPEDGKRAVINGVIFLVGLFVLVVYIYFKWDQYDGRYQGIRAAPTGSTGQEQDNRLND